MPDNLAGCRLCLELPGETGLSLGATGKKSIIAALVLSVSGASHRKMCSNPYFGKQAIRSQQNISACQALPCLQSRQSLRSLAVNPIQLQCSTSDFLGWALAASYSCLSILSRIHRLSAPSHFSLSNLSTTASFREASSSRVSHLCAGSFWDTAK